MRIFFDNNREAPDFTFLEMDRNGRFLDETRSPVMGEENIIDFLREQIDLPPDVTDVYLWVHGWQYTKHEAYTEATQLYANLDAWLIERGPAYPHLETSKPAYIYIHWPTDTSALGYYRMRSLARNMTERGDAEFVLSTLLHYLSEECQQRCSFNPDAGYKVHCLGHSFGGRFLVNAIRESGNPQSSFAAASLAPKVINSLTVFQMAAPNRKYGFEFERLLESKTLWGPITLTWSVYDRANRFLHTLADWEPGIGYRGLLEPSNIIGNREMKNIEQSYTKEDLKTPITNIDASDVFRRIRFFEGSHGDIWHDETLHLIASVTSISREHDLP